MKRDCVRLISKLAIFLLVLMAGRSFAHAQWTALSGAPSASTCLLLTDGSVMCQAGEQSTAWNRLTPKNGSYANGTWTALQSLPQPAVTGYGPLYYASGVLPDGRVFVSGGEYNNNYLSCRTPPPPVTNCPTTLGYVFDPTANGGTGQWSGPISVPAGYGGSDNSSVTLENGTTLIADVNSGNIYQLDPNALTLTLVAASGKLDSNDEEGWTILPDGTVLTVDANNTANLSTGGGSAYEFYDPATLTWSSPGYTPVNLADITATGKGSREVGPGVLRPDGVVVYFGGNVSGQNATYDTNTKIWTTATSFPLGSISQNSGIQLTVPDGPASILPDGNVLVEASPGVSGSTFPIGAQFFEFTLSGGALNPVSTSGGPNVSGEAAYHGRMLVLPTGEILYTHGGSDVYLYENIGSYQNAWRPVITTPPPSVIGLGNTYTVSGNLFNGLSMGGSYGDDVQESTNYPLVRITNNGTGDVFYARTHDHSRMGVEAVGDTTTVVSTSFDVPAGIEQGASELVVVTNGIPSANYDVNIEPASAIAFTAASATTSDYSDPAMVQAVLTAGGNPLTGKTVTFVLGAGGGTETCSTTTNGSGIATCTITPTQAAGTYTLTATFAADSSYAGSSVSTPFIVTPEEAAIAFTPASATTSDYDDAATVQAQLTTDGAALPGKSVTFVLGSGVGTETCSTMTDPSGNATCSITPNQAAGSYTLTASFAGDGFYVPASMKTAFTITKEEDTVAFTATSPTVIANGHSTTFAAVLKEDGVTPIEGRTVSITLGTGGTAQTCSGTTDPTGTASCTILVNQPLGPNTVAANFAGDAFYLPSMTSEPVILFAFLAQGSMIVGNLNAATGSQVEFWGAQWAGTNSLSGGPAPNAFKGFAGTAPQSCGGGWSGDTGNSGGPPASVPSYMGVIVSSSVVQSGSAITGNVPGIIVVKTNPGYGPSPGHAGTGTVVASFCP